jgi:hypothetical protein
MVRVHNNSASSSATTDVIKISAVFPFIVKYHRQFVAALEDAKLLCTVVSNAGTCVIYCLKRHCKYDNGIGSGAWKFRIPMYRHLRHWYMYEIPPQERLQMLYLTLGITVDMQHGHTAWTCSVDKQHRHAAWRCNMDMHHGHMDMEHGHAPWACCMVLQHWHAQWTCKMDMHDAQAS